MRDFAISQLGRIAPRGVRSASTSTRPSGARCSSLPGTPEITTIAVSESRNISLVKVRKEYDSTSSFRLKPMFRAVSEFRKLNAIPFE